jgi:hypothetical protein
MHHQQLDALLKIREKLLLANLVNFIYCRNSGVFDYRHPKILALYIDIMYIMFL